MGLCGEAFGFEVARSSGFAVLPGRNLRPLRDPAAEGIIAYPQRVLLEDAVVPKRTPARHGPRMVAQHGVGQGGVQDMYHVCGGLAQGPHV